MVKLKFIFDKEYDKATANNMLFTKRYTQEDIENMDSLYCASDKVLKKTQKMYQKTWDRVNDDFFKFIKKITGYDWAFDNYECVISVINPGASNQGNSNRILLWWRMNPYYLMRIVGHELVLHHYQHILRRYYSKEKLNDGQLWALSETAAYTLTSLPKEIQKLWPWHINYMGNHMSGMGYPQLDEIRLKLKEPFLKRKNFDDYIMKGIKLIKKYSKIGVIKK